jgi:hypothetical protein
MRFIEWHYEGGMEYMLPLTILLAFNLIMIGKTFYQLFIEGKAGSSQVRSLFTIHFISGFALAFGIFGQIMGLVGGFEAIEAAGMVDQNVLAGGLKVSSYSTMYGFTIFLISSFCYYFLKRKALTDQALASSELQNVSPTKIDRELVNTKV